MLRNTFASAAAVAAAATDVDPTIWRACAGVSVHIPTVGSRVYYFPQGHFEQCISTTITATNNSSSSSSLSLPPPPASSSSSSLPSLNLIAPPPFFLCRVISVRFLAHPLTDEPFACLHLVPIPPDDVSVPSADVRITRNDDDNVVVRPNNVQDSGEDDVVSFAKILTPSDANNGGGFSVPRFCADAIFPPLDFAAEPPVQNLIVRDVHGNAWEFRHIYRGTPRRHLLTTGWSKFVNSKKLVAGDSVVFMRRRETGELYAGVRRVLRDNDVSERWNCPVRSVKIEESSDWRNGKGRVAAETEAVLSALELAARGMAFEVVCYPRPGWAEFVVRAEAVEESMGVFWTSGMRVKMAMETEDSTRTTWFQGTVSSATMPGNGPWGGSPWRMLQITWDEPEVLQHVKRVNPWQVEYVVPAASLNAAFPPTKKLKALQNSGLLLHGEGEFALPVTRLSNSMMGQLNSSLLNYTFLPAGMQGARQNQLRESILSDFKNSSSHQTNTDKLVDSDMKPNLETVSTELNIGSPLSDSLSFDSQNSVHFSGTELVGKQGSHSSAKLGLSSFQLFGKIIHAGKPVEGGINDVGFTEGTRNNAYKEIEGADNALDLSLTYSYAKMIDRLDVRYPRASAVEATW